MEVAEIVTKCKIVADAIQATERSLFQIADENFVSELRSKREKYVPSVSQFALKKKRVKLLSQLREVPDDSNGIVYWMTRYQRGQNNLAFLYAQRLELKYNEPLHVCFYLVPTCLDATLRQYDFLLQGLKEVKKYFQECQNLNISFYLLSGIAADLPVDFVRCGTIGGLVTGFAPLRVPVQWMAIILFLVGKLLINLNIQHALSEAKFKETWNSI